MFQRYFNMKKIFLLILVIITLTSCSKDNKSVNLNDIKQKEEELKNYLIKVVEESKIIIDENNKASTDKVTLTLFYLDTCPHCHDELKWLSEIKNQYKNLNIVKYEVSKNEELYDLVLEKMKIDSYYVPLNIIGNYYNIGFDDDLKKEYLDIIDKYSKGKYCDVVSAIKNNKDVENCIKKNKSVDLSN